MFPALPRQSCATALLISLATLTLFACSSSDESPQGDPWELESNLDLGTEHDDADLGHADTGDPVDHGQMDTPPDRVDRGMPIDRGMPVEPDQPIDRGTPDNVCPMAVIAHRRGNQPWSQSPTTTIDPLGTLHLEDMSQDPEGSIRQLEWTLSQHPPGSTARFSPSASSPSATITFDIPGDYQITLQVFDDRKLENCEPTTLDVRVGPSPDDLHVQLSWQTPGDTTPLDDQGADLDLHLKKANATWNGMGDIYSANPQEDWGSPQDALDDPSLDIDSLSAATPENINLRRAPNGTYHLGVHYNSDDSNVGPAFATLRVFYKDRLILEEKDRLLSKPRDVWYLGSITFPGGQITRTDSITDGFP